MVGSDGGCRACLVMGASMWPLWAGRVGGALHSSWGKGSRAGTPELPLAGNPQSSPRSSRLLPMLTFCTPDLAQGHGGAREWM